MGLGAYVDENVANSHKLRLMDDRKRRASARLENSGLSHEELLRRQQELLAEVHYSITRLHFALFWNTHPSTSLSAAGCNGLVRLFGGRQRVAGGAAGRVAKESLAARVRLTTAHAAARAALRPLSRCCSPLRSGISATAERLSPGQRATSTRPTTWRGLRQLIHTHNSHMFKIWNWVIWSQI